MAFIGKPAVAGQTSQWDGTKWVSGSGMIQVMQYSTIESCISGTLPSSTAGNFTVGIGFAFQSPLSTTITGIKFYSALAAPGGIIRCKLWNSAGTALAHKDVNVPGPGLFTASFGTGSYTIVPSDYSKIFSVSTYVTAGTIYTKTTSPAFVMPTPFLAGYRMLITGLKLFSAGDAVPTTVASTEYYPVEPILTDAIMTGTLL